MPRKNVNDLKLELGQRFDAANTTVTIPAAVLQELKQVPEVDESADIGSPMPVARFGHLARNMTTTARMDHS